MLHDDKLCVSGRCNGARAGPHATAVRRRDALAGAARRRRPLALSKHVQLLSPAVVTIYRRVDGPLRARDSAILFTPDSAIVPLSHCAELYL
ncbi:hypothetical protein EVAR_9299_1 [Eumeta japonica]|uniref:Uncharacterized protein n=1 Tax=Eumeta variegata TaxID=151549 RepID=A0A4C1TNW1_EUMVA|nr:hypothetical protein EVAR_9299_1 [Eumeta japonica]